MAKSNGVESGVTETDTKEGTKCLPKVAIDDHPFLWNEWPQVENRAGGGKGCIGKSLSQKGSCCSDSGLSGTESGSSWREIRG